MIQALVPVLLIIAFAIYEMYIVKKPTRKNDLSIFFVHVDEIRTMINRCDSVSEWWTLDQEIDWLEETWRNRVPHQVLLQETGRLYDKWFKQRDFINRKTA